MTPEILKRMWQQRMSLLSQLQGQAFVLEGRNPDATERAAEERMNNELGELDKRIQKGMDDLEREGRSMAAFERYQKLTGYDRPQLSQRDNEAVEWFKSAILEKNPSAFVIAPEGQRDFTMSRPGLDWEKRDTLKSTATQALPVSVWPSFMLHLVEQTPVIRAGCTVLTTATGEDLQVPKSTAYQTGNLISEGGSITESDPTLAVVTLKSYKYAAFWQVSRELATDSPANLIDALSRGAATALAVSYGAHLATGTGSGQPNGFITAATVGVTGPTGTASSFGNQATAGQGTDLLVDLYASLQEPYLLSPAIGVLGRNATYSVFKKYKEGTTNRPMLDLTPVKAGASVNLLGMPGYVDPAIAAVGASAKSLAFGDWSRYFLRIVQGVRVERSDEFAFQNDLISFKAVIRLDGALIDLNAIKTFQHSAT
jgi:HK97 family phage major capsid protein